MFMIQCALCVPKTRYFGLNLVCWYLLQEPFLARNFKLVCSEIIHFSLGYENCGFKVIVITGTTCFEEEINQVIPKYVHVHITLTYCFIVNYALFQKVVKTA